MTVPVRAVIFDLDGTLLDHRGAVASALTQWLPAFGVEATDELIAAWFKAEERHLPAWRARQISLAEQRRRRLQDFLPLLGATAGDDADLDAVFDGYLTCYEASWIPFADVEPSLEALASSPFKFAVLTNGSEEQQNAKLDAVGLRGRVGPVFTAEGLGVAKPDPSTYLTVCASLGVSPDAALHVGDHHDLDVLAPRGAGLHAVHLDRLDAGPYDEVHRIRSLTQLPPLLAT